MIESIYIYNRNDIERTCNKIDIKLKHRVKPIHINPIELKMKYKSEFLSVINILKIFQFFKIV